MKKIADSCSVSSSDDRLRNVMTSLGYSFCYTLYGQFW